MLTRKKYHSHSQRNIADYLDKERVSFISSFPLFIPFCVFFHYESMGRQV
jgi:hypothetical protein